MWVLKRVQEGSNGSDKSSHYLIIGEYLVGRKGCQIQVSGDQTVSRKHAYITVNCSETKQTSTAHVSIKDVSKYGTSVNDVKCQNSVSVELKHGDEITFGTQGSSYRLTCEPLVIFASCLDTSKKKLLKSQIVKLGGYMVNEWQKECTHLVMDALSFTIKVIYALVSCCPIVKTSYFEDLLQDITSNSELPVAERYMPPIREELIDPNVVSFHPREARKSLFAGKQFLFLEQKQFKRLEQAIRLAGGGSLLKECGDIHDDQDLLIDVNTLVMSVDLKSKVSPDKEVWIGHVGDVLTSCNRRPIAETEVGLAILHLSLNEYCNSSMDHIPSITRHIVSKSLSSMEAMSQRVNESQNISVMSIPEKKPFSCRTDVDQSKKTRTSTSSKITHQETRKRSRGDSSDALPLASDTPLTENTPLETKRQKLSVSEVTHISQTPGMTPRDGNNENKLSSLKSEVTHISQSQNSAPHELSENSSRSLDQRTKSLHDLTTPKSEVTHISQSQHSASDQVSNTSCGNLDKNRNLTIVKSEVTHISQSEDSGVEEKASDSFIDVAVERKRRRSSVVEPEVTNISQRRDSPTEVEICETPSPVISPQDKRRRLAAKSDITHISQTERSLVEKHASPSQDEAFSLTSEHASSRKSKSSFKQEDITEIQTSEGFEDLTSSRTPKSHATDRKSANTRGTKRFVESQNDISVENNSSRSKETGDEQEVGDLGTEEFSAVRMPGNEDPRDSTLKDATPGSGWISRKSPRGQRAKTSQSSTVDSKDEFKNKGTENLDSGNEDLNGGTRREPISQKLTEQGFLSTQEGRKTPRTVVVKEEGDLDLPTNVVCIEYVELVVARSIPRKNRVAVNNNNTTNLKNTKRFRKQNYAGDDSGLPRIIGGSDLVAFSSRNKDVEDWFIEIQQKNKERDLEDQDADNLFRYDPPNKRRNRR